MHMHTHTPESKPLSKHFNFIMFTSHFSTQNIHLIIRLSPKTYFIVLKIQSLFKGKI